MRFLLVGNYGVGNLGDELLREYFLKTFPEIDWVVLSAAHSQFSIPCPSVAPQERRGINSQFHSVPRLPFGLRSLLATPWWRTIAALRHSDGMVFGGGTLFTDIESVKAPMLWWWHALWAWMFGKKIILAFQGIGPFRTRVGEWCGRWVVKHAELTIIRDAISFQRIAPWKKARCLQAFDPVLSLFGEEKAHADKKIFVVIPRANATQEFLQRVTATWQQRKGEWAGACIVSLEPDNPLEKDMSASLARSLSAPIADVRTYAELKHALEDAAFVLTQRYHGAIAAMGLNILYEAVPQQAGDKLAGLQGVDRSEALQRIRRGEEALREVFHL